LEIVDAEDKKRPARSTRILTHSAKRSSPMLASMPELLSVTQAAQCLGLGRATLYRLLATGLVPVDQFRIGRDTRLSRRQIEAWLEGRFTSRTLPASTADELLEVFRSPAS
jgi:excisionase family DNA binding protein